MFTIDDEEQEKKRELWYKPLGEFLVLFSNVEFTAQEWSRLVCDSNAMYKHLVGMWQFQKRVELLIELIGESSASSDWKNEAIALWKEAIGIANIRNTIAHNPPFENSKMEIDENLRIRSVSSPIMEISKLSKPIGEPGSGVTLEKVIAACLQLRRILTELDRASIEELMRQERSGSA
ncbi:MAG: hypothetical protein JAY72_21205 [Candidatus Thiodiazotropha endolucinida]|nr:hypothetical protein [Candidatus Thiodiazotropha taylori]MCW4324202.1 hypothetical protein [Candidatus Thiodiazotropha taylori]